MRTLLAALVLAAVPGGVAPSYAADDPVGVWPLRPAPEVVAGFDPPESTWGAGHRGVDLLGSPGQPVRTALPGTVAFTGMIAGRGVITVDHGDTRTTYEPVTSTRSPGDEVAAGDVIGHLDLPGSHCFPRACLHWGWLRGETYLDPLGLVGGGPVRLLPLDGLPAAPAAVTPGAARTAPTPYAVWQPLETLASLAPQEPPLLRLLRPGVQP